MSVPAIEHAAENAATLPYLFTLVGVMLIICFYAGKLVKKTKLPSLIGYMIVGAMFGPSFASLHLEFFTEPVLHSLSFVTQIALGFVAFSIGAELSMKSLKRLGSGIVWIIFVESFAAFAVVTALIYAITKDLPMALIFGSMAPASAPAGTVAIIQEYKAKGSLTQALYAVVGFDDGLAIFIFGFAAAISKTILEAETGATSSGFLATLAAPTIEIVLSIVVGTVLGFIFGQLVRRINNSRDMLIIVFAFVTLGTGLSMLWHLSLILTNMVIGFVLVNTRREALVHRVTAPLTEIMPLTFVLFFCMAGAHLQLSALPALGLVGITYIIGRSAGLIGGARLGATFGHVEDKIKKYVGLGILSQAGVAIGLALIVGQEFAGIGALDEHGVAHGDAIATKVITTITATCIVFEIIGPILAKYALGKAGELGKATR